MLAELPAVPAAFPGRDTAVVAASDMLAAPVAPAAVGRGGGGCGVGGGVGGGRRAVSVYGRAIPPRQPPRQDQAHGPLPSRQCGLWRRTTVAAAMSGGDTAAEAASNVSAPRDACSLARWCCWWGWRRSPAATAAIDDTVDDDGAVMITGGAAATPAVLAAAGGGGLGGGGRSCLRGSPSAGVRSLPRRPLVAQ